MTALVLSCCLCLVPTAAAYDARAAISPIKPVTSGVGSANLLANDGAIDAVTEAVSSVGTVRSVAQVDTAVEAEEAAKAKAAAEAAAAAAAAAAKEEAARKAAMDYTPVYGQTVAYSVSRTASEAVKANGTLMGKYKLTFYCGCAKCCGKWTGGQTSSGVKAKEGRTIAVDSSVIPIGSKVYIEGFGDFIAEDVGGAIKGNKIDIYLNDHSRCNDLGVKYANVFVVK